MNALVIGLMIGLGTMAYVVYLSTHMDENKHSHE